MTALVTQNEIPVSPANPDVALSAFVTDLLQSCHCLPLVFHMLVKELLEGTKNAGGMLIRHEGVVCRARLGVWEIEGHPG